MADLEQRLRDMGHAVHHTPVALTPRRDSVGRMRRTRVATALTMVLLLAGGAAGAFAGLRALREPGGGDPELTRKIQEAVAASTQLGSSRVYMENGAEWEGNMFAEQMTDNFTTRMLGVQDFNTGESQMRTIAGIGSSPQGIFNSFNESRFVDGRLYWRIGRLGTFKWYGMDSPSGMLRETKSDPAPYFGSGLPTGDAFFGVFEVVAGDFVLVGEEIVREAATVRYAAELSVPDLMRQANMTMPPDFQVDPPKLDVWIDDAGLVRRWSTSFTFNFDDDSFTNTMMMELFDFGVDVNVKPPREFTEVESFEDIAKLIGPFETEVSNGDGPQEIGFTYEGVNPGLGITFVDHLCLVLPDWADEAQLLSDADGAPLAVVERGMEIPESGLDFEGSACSASIPEDLREQMTASISDYRLRFSGDGRSETVRLTLIPAPDLD